MISVSRHLLTEMRKHDASISEATIAQRLLELIADRRGALNPKTAVARRNAALDGALDTVLNSGFLRIYDSTQPTDADTALGAQVLLAELTLNATAFAAASGGSKAANAITADSSANATGTATWASLVTSGGTRLMDMSAGTATVNLVLNSAAISSGASVSCSSLSVTQAA